MYIMIARSKYWQIIFVNAKYVLDIHTAINKV
jgi:hypothetical protein